MESEADEPEKTKYLLKQVEESDIKFVEMQFSDLLGTVKSVSIPARKLRKAIEDGIYIDGSSIIGYSGIEESDMRAKPVLDSFQIYPWTENGQMKTARLMCTILDPSLDDDGNSRFPGDPRLILERMLKKIRKKGWIFNVGPEFEFFLFKLGVNERPFKKPSDVGGYFDLMPLDKGEMVRKTIMLTFDQMGFDVEESHHEVAPGQQEIDLKYGDAMTIADRMMTMKLGIRTIARQFGLHATFMPKPFTDQYGSAMHVHQSLTDLNGENVFYDADNEYGLSDLALKYIGGLLKHAKATCAILTSHINSYRRLVPGFEAPYCITWANMNRSALIRVPAGRDSKTRVEHRNPDPAGNPYLQFAVMLAAGLDGIENDIYPPDPFEMDTFKMDKEELNEKGIRRLPENLGESLQYMRESKLMREALGDHAFYNFLRIKEKEWTEFHRQVTDWELDRYLMKI
jgi:glutamine synthetase